MSSFGFSGTIAHAVLKQAEGEARRSIVHPNDVVEHETKFGQGNILSMFKDDKSVLL